MIIVDTVASIEPRIASALTAAQHAVINVTGGQKALLDLSQEAHRGWLSIIEELHQHQAPVFLDVDPSSGLVSDLLIPDVFRVVAIDPVVDDDRVNVTFEISHSRHHLRASSPRYAHLLAVLTAARDRGARVLVTETDLDHEIIDVREVLDGSHSYALDAPGTGLTAERARILFDSASATACPSGPPGGISSPCIPFLYPDDGCWARAHEMYRVMRPLLAPEEVPHLRKAWLYANTSLRVKTDHSPQCSVSWGWHVAPAVNVSSATGVSQCIIDPSLFGSVVTIQTWIEAQSDPRATLAYSAPDVFYRSSSGHVSYDPDFSQTRSVLEKYRLKFKVRVIKNGSPPYPCAHGVA